MLEVTCPRVLGGTHRILLLGFRENTGQENSVRSLEGWLLDPYEDK